MKNITPSIKSTVVFNTQINPPTLSHFPQNTCNIVADRVFTRDAFVVRLAIILNLPKPRVLSEDAL